MGNCECQCLKQNEGQITLSIIHGKISIRSSEADNDCSSQISKIRISSYSNADDDSQEESFKTKKQQKQTDVLKREANEEISSATQDQTFSEGGDLSERSFTKKSWLFQNQKLFQNRSQLIFTRYNKNQRQSCMNLRETTYNFDESQIRYAGLSVISQANPSSQDSKISSSFANSLPSMRR